MLFSPAEILAAYLTLGDVLAAGCTYNHSYVSRVLNEEMGMSFAAYDNRLRLCYKGHKGTPNKPLRKEK